MNLQTVFCPNMACPDKHQVGKGNIVKYGKSPQGRQRYQCRVCKKVFNERMGTLFYGNER